MAGQLPGQMQPPRHRPLRERGSRRSFLSSPASAQSIRPDHGVCGREYTEAAPPRPTGAFRIVLGASCSACLDGGQRPTGGLSHRVGCRNARDRVGLVAVVARRGWPGRAPLVWSPVAPLRRMAVPFHVKQHGPTCGKGTHATGDEPATQCLVVGGARGAASTGRGLDRPAGPRDPMRAAGHGSLADPPLRRPVAGAPTAPGNEASEPACIAPWPRPTSSSSPSRDKCR